MEAKKNGCNMVIAHHPIIFSGLKKLNGKNYIERTVIAAIKNDIAIYAAHTNMDNIIDGVNRMIARFTRSKTSVSFHIKTTLIVITNGAGSS